jgi:SAM-dependent methyltransferase
MRNAVTEFYIDVLRKLIAAGTVAKSDRVLVVCGGLLDEEVFQIAGFSDVTVTNVDDKMSNTFQDAENLTYGDKSFDLVVVHAGLHHCRSPHRALLEMYRVARKCTVAFEARNSLLMRTAVRLGLTAAYELEAVSGDFQTGGVANGPVPNFVYRWTERGVSDTIASYDPAYQQQIRFFYGLRLPLQRLAATGRPVLRLVLRAVEPLSRRFVLVARRQCNAFAFAISKSNRLQPWMQTEQLMSREFVEASGRMYPRRPAV